VSEQKQNTDRELWREPGDWPNGDYYAPSIHVTAWGNIGIDCDGMVYVAPVREWHKAMMLKAGHERIIAEQKAEIERLKQEHASAIVKARIEELQVSKAVIVHEAVREIFKVLDVSFSRGRYFANLRQQTMEIIIEQHFERHIADLTREAEGGTQR